MRAIRYNIVEMKRSSDFDTVLDFFHAMRGRLHGFRFKDWSDWKSNGMDRGVNVTNTDQSIGTGDGATTDFQLSLTYTAGSQSYVRNITKPVAGSVVVAVDGVSQTYTTNWTIDTTTGIVTFTAGHIPTAGQAITAGFEFDVPVRFDTDDFIAQHKTTCLNLSTCLLSRYVSNAANCISRDDHAHRRRNNVPRDVLEADDVPYCRSLMSERMNTGDLYITDTYGSNPQMARNGNGEHTLGAQINVRWHCVTLRQLPAAFLHHKRLIIIHRHILVCHRRIQTSGCNISLRLR